MPDQAQLNPAAGRAPSPWGRRLRRLGPTLLALALFAGLSLGAAHPLWEDLPARIEIEMDPLLNAWILDHAQVSFFHNPLHLFQADIFWPNHEGVAYGEHLIAQALLALPFRLCTTNPVALHNLCLIQGYFLSAVAAWLLGLYYFRRSAPALLCGMAYGLAAYHVNQSSHIQLVHGEFLPLAVLAFEHALASRRRAWDWLLGLALLGQWLTSWYWTVFTFWCLVPYFAVRLWQERHGLTWRRVAWLALPATLCAALMLPLAWPTIRLMQAGQMTLRTMEERLTFKAVPPHYLIPMRHSLLYGWLTTKVSWEVTLFPGLAVGAAFFVTLIRAGARRRPALQPPAPAGEARFPLRLWLAITLLLLSFTFGDYTTLSLGGRTYNIPLPLALLHWFPLAGQMRVPSRWMLPASLGLALLVGDLWRWLWALQVPRARLLASLYFLLAGVECLTRPSIYVDVPRDVPPAMTYLNRQPYPSPVCIMPFFFRSLMNEAAWLHQPMINGYNGYLPRGHFALLADIMFSFPESKAVERLRQLGIHYVVININQTRQFIPGGDTTEMLAQLEQLFSGKTVRMGNYLIVDITPTETDPARIVGNYKNMIADLERQAIDVDAMPAFQRQAAE